jgi:hypothetical protein
MIERIVSLGADYVSTVGALARTEARQDLSRLATALRARLIGLVVLAVGAAWLNVALLLWLLSTPHALPGALAIGLLGLAVGGWMSSRAGRMTGRLTMLESTRRVLADEFGHRGGADMPMPEGLPERMLPAEAGVRLQAIREEMRETLTLHRGPQGEPVDEYVQAFEPRSRTMRSLMWLWRVIPRVPAGTAMFSALGVLAVSSPRLRRLVAVMALLRNLGAHPRHGPHRPSMSPPS